MSLLSLSEACEDSAFQRRCRMALLAPARDILNEDPGTANHTARLEWAHKVLTDMLAITPRQVALQILRNPTIAATESMADVTDGDIEYQVGQVLADFVTIG